MPKIITAIIFMTLLFTSGCGLPTESEISKSIQNGMIYTIEKSWDKALDEVKMVEDYVHLTEYRYDKEKRIKIEDQVEQIEKSLIIMDQAEAKQKWNGLKHTWAKTKNTTEKH